MKPCPFPLPGFLALLAFPVLLAGRGAAQEDLSGRVDALERKNAELEARLAALAEEQESLSLGSVLEDSVGVHGLGPAASRVYASGEGLSLGGYGEGLYQRRNGDTSDELDLLRVVLYLGYRFDEHWVFNAELEYEHAGEEVGLEFATLDRLWREELNFRAGLLLIPMGFVNEQHEPPTYLAVTRAETERRILPSTWRENGLGLFGDVGPVSYRAYVVNGFDATGFSAQGLRDGRQNGSEALAEDLAVVGRLDWTAVPGLLAGGSLYRGDAGQDQAGLGATTTTIAELHAEWHARGLWARALVAGAWLDDVAQLNAAQGLVGSDSVGEQLRGGYVELGFDVLTWLAPGSEQSLSPYLRFESLDTQHEVPAGFSADPASDSDLLSLGLNWRPRSNLVFKAEYQDVDDADDGLNLSMGFSF